MCGWRCGSEKQERGAGREQECSQSSHDIISSLMVIRRSVLPDFSFPSRPFNCLTPPSFPSFHLPEAAEALSMPKLQSYDIVDLLLIIEDRTRKKDTNMLYIEYYSTNRYLICI
jgi:hypothetical protein